MIYNYPRFPNGKTKAVTMSYDDGTIHDVRFAETLNKYGLKCTFNLVGSRVVKGDGISNEFIKENIIGKGHEIANHGYFHRAQDAIRPIEAIRDILDSRLTLEKEFGMIIRGMAFPDRSVNRFVKPDIYKEVKSRLVDLDIVYSRCAGGENDNFKLPDDWHNWETTAHHKNPRLMEYIDKFLDFDVDSQYISARIPRLFFVWGHSFEFDRDNNWEILDTMCQKLSGRDEIWYATNIEIYNYINAYNSLIYSADGLTVYNPTLYEIWFDVDSTLYHITPGETLTLKEEV
ncbi:MAG: polysaccharide deacetylase family protein [Clostridia bacterium]|nr:polysaccharide deacetylase family protein [Clostridia bacterium]